MNPAEPGREKKLDRVGGGEGVLVARWRVPYTLQGGACYSVSANMSLVRISANGVDLIFREKSSVWILT